MMRSRVYQIERKRRRRRRRKKEKKRSVSKQDLKCIKLYFLFGESGYPVTDELFYVDSPVHQVVDAVTDQTSLVSNYPESIGQTSSLSYSSTLFLEKFSSIRNRTIPSLERRFPFATIRGLEGRRGVLRT